MNVSEAMQTNPVTEKVRESNPQITQSRATQEAKLQTSESDVVQQRKQRAGHT